MYSFLLFHRLMINIQYITLCIVTYVAACLYGDRSLGCPILVPEDTEQCTSDQEDACCETCYQLTVTTPATTVNPCQDTVSYDWPLRHSTLKQPFFWYF